MKNFKLCTAEPSEAKALHQFEKKCFQHKVDQFPVRNLRYMIKSKTCITLLLKDKEGKIAGEVIGFLRHFKIPSGRVYKIGVDPEIQAKGVGSYLLKEIESIFKKSGMVKSCAEVRVGNASSRAMFCKNGYKLSGDLPGYYANGEDGVKFWKVLSK